jgi:hypothetical protein
VQRVPSAAPAATCTPVEQRSNPSRRRDAAFLSPATGDVAGAAGTDRASHGPAPSGGPRSAPMAAPQREQFMRQDGLASVVAAMTVFVTPQAGQVLASDVRTVRVKGASLTRRFNACAQHFLMPR